MSTSFEYQNEGSERDQRRDNLNIKEVSRHGKRSRKICQTYPGSFRLKFNQIALEEVKTLKAAHKLVFMLDGVLNMGMNLYWAREIISEVKEDREIAYQTARRAAEIRLLAEAKLGELISNTEFNKGERGKTGSNGAICLRDPGLTKCHSSRLQKVAEHKELIPEAVESTDWRENFA